MNEAITETTTPEVPTTGEVQEVVQAVEQLTEVIVQQQEAENKEKEVAADEEKTVVELLTELNQTLTPTEEELIAQEEFMMLQAGTDEEFRASLLQGLQDLNEQLTEQNDLQEQSFLEVFPSVKQASDLSIIFLCLIPLFIVCLLYTSPSPRDS